MTARSGTLRPGSRTADAAIEMARGIGAAFAPSHGRRALYSDTNFQLLGLVIEQVLGVPYETALRSEVVEPLALRLMQRLVRATG